MLADTGPFADEDEGEAFDFDDSGDDVPEADRPPPTPPAPAPDPSPDPRTPPAASETAPSHTATPVVTHCSSTAGETEGTSAAEGDHDQETDLPPPPPPPLEEDVEADPGRTGLPLKTVVLLLLWLEDNESIWVFCSCSYREKRPSTTALCALQCLIFLVFLSAIKHSPHSCDTLYLAPSQALPAKLR